MSEWATVNIQSVREWLRDGLQKETTLDKVEHEVLLDIFERTDIHEPEIERLAGFDGSLAEVAEQISKGEPRDWGYPVADW